MQHIWQFKYKKIKKDQKDVGKNLFYYLSDCDVLDKYCKRPRRLEDIDN